MAVGLGFDDLDDLRATTWRIAQTLAAGEPLSRFDWTRALLVTEVMLASDIVGAGVDWAFLTELGDAGSLPVLRSIQRLLIGVCVPLGPR